MTLLNEPADSGLHFPLPAGMLLERLGLPFETVRPAASEDHMAGEMPSRPGVCASRSPRPRRWRRSHPDAVVIGSDQVAALGHPVLDKPGDAATCRSQLPL